MAHIAGTLTAIPAMSLLLLAIALLLLAFGVAKFAHYEQIAVNNLVAGHPILKLGPQVLGASGFSLLLGVVELAAAALLVLGLFSASLGMLGGLLGVLTFVVTLSLFPFVQYFEPEAGRAFLSSRGQFLMKDLGLFGASLAIASHHVSQLV